jgi:hypothetical protein
VLRDIEVAVDVGPDAWGSAILFSASVMPASRSLTLSLYHCSSMKTRWRQSQYAVVEIGTY